MTYRVDDGGSNPHINYEPTTLGGLARHRVRRIRRGGRR